MGNRISVQFVNGEQRSVALFSHWRGLELLREATAYAKELRAWAKGREGLPLERLEPDTVMVDFIRYLTVGMARVEHDLYLGATDADGDNSDNGHHLVALPVRTRAKAS